MLKIRIRRDGISDPNGRLPAAAPAHSPGRTPGGTVAPVQIASRTRPLVLGHRGASAHAPDNTLEAFRLAVDHGADGVELDVRFTADGAIIVHHDPGLHDFGVFAHRTLEELRSFAPDVPTLEEAAAVLGDVLIDVEIKNDPAQPDHDPAHRMADAVVEWAVARSGRTIVSSFNPVTIDRVRSLDQALETGRLLDAFTQPSTEIGRVAGGGHGWLMPSRRHVRTGGAALVTAAHDAGLAVAVWTVDSARLLRKFDATGVDAVITNDPRRALAVYSG